MKVFVTIIMALVLVLGSCTKNEPGTQPLPEVVKKDTNSPEVTDGDKIGFLYVEPTYPFPNGNTYNAHVILPQVDQANMNETVIEFYKQWKNRYLKSFNDSMSYVHYTLEYEVGDAISCSEGHGFGMLITVLMAGVDSTSFDDFIKLYRWYNYHRSEMNPDLMAWQQNSEGTNSSGATSATDGDLDIAYSLLLAEKQWGANNVLDFRNEASRIISAIYKSDVSSVYGHIELGDWVNSGNYARSTRFCDYMMDHWRLFEKEDANNWDLLIHKSYEIINEVADSATGLYPDFAILENGKYKACEANFLEGPNDGNYYYNSCRAPWRIATDYIVNADTSALESLLRLNRWVIGKTGGKPSEIKGGYKLNGEALNTWSDMAFTAPFGVCAMVDADNQQWLDAMWRQIANEKITSGAYFGNSIKMLCLITMSGNWWIP